jgi:hypothetical protein
VIGRFVQKEQVGRTLSKVSKDESGALSVGQVANDLRLLGTC